MKVVAVLMVAAFVFAAGTSFAFAACPGHNKAQLVKTQPQVQMSQDQPASAPFTVAEKAEPVKPAAKLPEKK